MAEVEAVSLRTTFILMLAFIVLGTFAFFDPLRLQQKKDQEKERNEHVFWLKEKKLSSLRIQTASLDLQLECANKEGCTFDGSADWNVLAPVKDEADSSSVGSLASSALNLNPVDKVDLEQLPDPLEFGFDKSSAVLELNIVGEAEPYRLSFGKETPVGPNTYALSNREPKRVYMVANYFPGMLKQELFHWRNKRLFKGLETGEIEAIDWRSNTGAFRLAKKEGVWSLESPLAAPANHIMSEGLASTLVFAAAKSLYAPETKEAKEAKKILSGKPAFQFTLQRKGATPMQLSLFQLAATKPGEKNFLAQVKGRETLYVVDSLQFARFGKPLLEYRERRVVSADDKSRANELQLTFPREKKRIFLKLESTDWQFAEGDKPEALSQTRIKNFVDSLASAEAFAFDKGPKSILFQRAPADLEVELRSNGAAIKKARFLVAARKEALTEGDIPGEVRVLGEDFLKLLPVRFADLFEANNKQVVIPAGEKQEESHDGHDHSAGEH